MEGRRYVKDVFHVPLTHLLSRFDFELSHYGIDSSLAKLKSSTPNVAVGVPTALPSDMFL